MAIKTEPKGPKPPLAGLTKLDVFYTALGPPVVHVHNIMHTMSNPNTPLSPTDMATLATDFYNSWANSIHLQVSNQYTLVSVVATALDGTGTEGVHNGSALGGQGTAPLPPQAAVAITWKASFAWRGGRPRTYVGGVPGSALANTSGAGLSSTYSGALNTQAQGLISGVNAIVIGSHSFSLGFPSYYSKGNFRIPPLWFPFTSSVVHDRLDSQRRRSGKESTYGVD